MKINTKLFLIFFLLIIPFFNVGAQQKDLLSEEERYWLSSRNNTIVVYPEKSFAPFSYQTSSGIPLGLSIDYLELVSQIVGFKIEYLPAKSLVQILEDIKNGKGDLTVALIEDQEKSDFLYFSDEYIDISSVIVVRKDSKIKNGITLNDLTGNKVAITEGRAIHNFISKNYPRIILEEVTDDEIALQQLVLGEVDAVVLDIASLSFYLSKQVLSSVHIVGNAGFSYKLSFAVPKDKQILQSIIDKGLTQISKNERAILNEKWIISPEEQKQNFGLMIRNTLTNDVFQYTFFLLVISILFFIIFKNKKKSFLYKKEKIKSIKNEVEELGEMSEILNQELEHIKKTEEELKNKLKSLD